MLFVSNNYDVQINANRMNNMGQFRCHYRPLPVCGTIETKTTIKKTAADLTTKNELQKQPQVQQYESLQVLENCLLKPSVVNEQDITYPNNVRNDISSSFISWFKRHRRHQRQLRLLRSSLLKVYLRGQRSDLLKNLNSGLNWRHILLKI